MLYELHVFGLNLSAIPAQHRAALTISRADAARVLRGLARSHSALEAVILRGRYHVEAFVVVPRGGGAPRAWIRQLRVVRPDLLTPPARALHYHLAGSAAARHLARVAGGHLAARPGAAASGVKAALVLAARCGTLGETLDGLFVRALRDVDRVPQPRPAPAAP